MRVDDGSLTDLCPWLDDSLTRKEFRCALVTVRKRSAPGLDQVSFEMLSQLPMEYDNLLLEVFNLIFAEVSFPESWKSSLVVLIPKSGGQSGFRPFRSYDDNLATLVTSIRTGFLDGQLTVAVFLDIEGAFDTHIFIDDLRELGVPARFRKFVENLISVRSLSFVVEGELQGPFFALRGTPQGSTLSL
ncbi:PREDICTED: uncharacterized protein LOC108763266 [Trachymyrmex cornetzi]|uniref:uncharacterized protein LOC108763266 n=1 Tax=Trachymyrmex cornetzi TaxID=471704 RepID=UPI00084F69D2|nr:PREDICTED: uncharacterized protein LOC108763266 [Trachymyrmex cornetzi]